MNGTTNIPLMVNKVAINTDWIEDSIIIKIQKAIAETLNIVFFTSDPLQANFRQAKEQTA